MGPLIGAVWSLVARSALLSSATRTVAVSFARDVAKGLVVSALDRAINPTQIQIDFAQQTASNTSAIDTEAGRIDMMSRVLETIRERQTRNEGAEQLAEIVSVHYKEGGRQRSASVLAMTSAVQDDLYYPLLVYATLINSRPISNTKEAALFSACLYTWYIDPATYFGVFSLKGGMKDDMADIRRTPINASIWYFFFGKSWNTVKEDEYTIGDIADQMEKDPSWIRLGNYIMVLRLMSLDEIGETQLPGIEGKFDSVAILNYAIDRGVSQMSDDRQYLHKLHNQTDPNVYYEAADYMNNSYFKAVYVTSISTGRNVPAVTDDKFKSHLNSIATLSHGILDPRQRGELCQALQKLSEEIKRDLA